MHPGTRRQTDPSAVPLHNAVLCVDCECVTNCLSDECLVCGSRSLFSLARMLGGTQLSPTVRPSKIVPNTASFDVEMSIDLKQIEPRELNAIVEGITDLLGPSLVREKARFRIDVEPVVGARNTEQSRAA